jgi:tetratricopeptide (TPR) repeat protein
LKIKMEIGDRNGEGNALGNIGIVYSNLGDYPKAISYYERARKIMKEIGVSTHGVEANLGDAYLEQGRLEEAYEIYQKVKDSSRLGRYYLRAGKYKDAGDTFTRYLNLNETKEMPSADAIYSAYIGRGLSYEGQLDCPQAIRFYQKGIDLIEKQRGALSGAERERFLESKLGLFSRLEPYNGMIRALIKEKEKDYKKTSLLYAERSKSRTFLEMLAARGLKGKAEGDITSLAKERTFQQELLVLRKRMEVLNQLGEKAPPGEFTQLKRETDKKKTEYEGFIKEVKLKNSELASLITVNPSPVEKIQGFLNKDITLLEFYSTEDTLYAWLLKQDDIRVYEIPIKEEDLKKKVAEFLFHISTKSNRIVPLMPPAVGDEDKKNASERETEKPSSKLARGASEFYNLILAPLEKNIKTKHLIIVPHGALHKIPFSALNDGQNYLIDKYSISVLPAASLIEHVIKKRKAEKESLLVFANPKTDSPPLNFAEAEGKTVSKMFSQNKLYFGENATETMAKKKAPEFNIIHFATHGEFNERQPLQSGLLLTKDEENDGYLQVHEIFDMDLKNANLVALSACETGLSKILGGDDLVGLSRGFIYAGTPSILATLWKVDDPATSQLMEVFYKNWKQGMSKPEALRKAQLDLKNIPQFKHPYYWAPFVMFGDWK